MRTTITISDETFNALKKRAFETGKSFKQVVNETLVAGLQGDSPAKRKRGRFKTKTYAMGIPRIDLTKATQISGELEDEEILRKMERRR